MESKLALLIIGAGIFLIIALLYLLRKQVLLFGINRIISIMQRFILKVIVTVGDHEPEWVLVEFPAPGQFSLAILTESYKDKSTVFVPSGPKLIPGQMVFIRKHQMRILNISFDEGIKMLISLGLLPETNCISKEIWRRMEEF